MTIKIQCDCGLKIAFDVEPENGRMPVPIPCPDCARDVTPLANEFIAAATRSVPPAATPVIRVTSPNSPAPVVPRASVAPSAAGPTQLSMGGGHGSPAAATVSSPAASASPPAQPVAVVISSGPAPAAEPPPSPASESPSPAPGVRCAKHLNQTSVETCVVCGKPICLQCMAQFGYLCSVYCTEQSRKRGIPVPVYAGQKVEQWKDEVQKGNRLIMAVAAGCAVLFAGWAFNKFYLSRPRPVFAMTTDQRVPFLHAQFVDSTRVFTATTERLTVRDWTSGKEVWTAEIAAPKSSESERRFASSATRRPAGSVSEDDVLPGQLNDALPDMDHFAGSDGPIVRIVGGDVWVASGNRAKRHDLKTGSRKAEVAVPEPVDSWIPDDQGFVAVGSSNQLHRQVSRVALANGAVQTDTIRLKAKRVLVGEEGNATGWAYVPLTHLEIVPAGPTVAALDLRLTESRVIERSAVKTRSSSALDREGGVRQSDTDSIVGEFINEGATPVTEDFSLYEVNLRRLFSATAPWTGTVSGRPTLFPLKTVDLLIAGTNVIAFDKNNRKLWESKLTYRIPKQFDRGVVDMDGSVGSSGSGPALESGSRLYLIDQGNLSALDSRDGRVAWRVPSVGITEVWPVGNALYVSTTDAGPESIRYSKDFTVQGKGTRINMKVDAATGKVLWEQARLADQFRAAGPYLYGGRSQEFAFDKIGANADSRPHYYLRRIHPGSGKTIWEYYQRYAASSFEARDKLLLLHDPQNVTVLRFR